MLVFFNINFISLCEFDLIAYVYNKEKLMSINNQKIRLKDMRENFFVRNNELL